MWIRSTIVCLRSKKRNDSEIKSESRSILRSVARVRNSCITPWVLAAIRVMRLRSSWANSSFASRSPIACSRALLASQSALRSAISSSSCFASSFSAVKCSVAARSRLRNWLMPSSSGVIDRARSMSSALSLKMRSTIDEGLRFATKLRQPLIAKVVEQRPAIRR